MSTGRQLAAATALATIAVTTACGCGHHTGTTSPMPGGSVAPLTGLPVAADSPVLQRPAIFVKIENAAAARPQSGLDKADVVYEAVAEGGITRFAAIFQSKDPGRVGPVRSVRPQDADLAAPLHGLAAFSGGLSAFVRPLDEVAQDLSADRIGEGRPYMRVSSRRAPHNLYLDVADLWPKANDDHKRPPPPLFSYGSLSAAATPARSVTVRMSAPVTVTWSWDGTAWRRTQDGQPFTVTDGRIGPRNVLVQSVSLSSTRYVDPAGTPVPAADLIGSGPALLFRDGRELTGTWRKPDRSAVTRFAAADGATMLLRPGPTWVELAPSGTTISVSR